MVPFISSIRSHVRRSSIGLFFLISLVTLASCGGDAKEPEEPQLSNIVETAASDGRFTSLVAALNATGLDETLSDADSTFTVFAPTDDAFAKLGDALNDLLNDPDTLSNILLYHVVVDSEIGSRAAIAAAGSDLTMANNDTVAVSLRDGDLFINDSQVIITDVMASNGIIHAIDTVLTPPAPEPDPEPELANIVDTAVAAGQFQTLVTALQATDLDEALANEDETFTVFAPTDDAFALLGEETIAALLNDTDTLANILTYHVIAGSEIDSAGAIAAAGSMVEMLNGDTVEVSLRNDSLFINDSEVIITDVKATNGIIHAIDAVLMPPAPEPELVNIVQTAVNAGSFTTLVAALQAAELDEALANERASFTVFAPTDAAFAELGSVVDDLLNDIPTLTNILQYHVVAGTVIDSEAAIAAAGEMVEMLNGDTVEVVLDGDRLFINDSEVVITDVEASNGVIHVIDAVLTPPEPEPALANIVDTAVGAGNFTTLVAALDATGLDNALSNENAELTVFAPTDDAFALLGTDTINALLNDLDTLSNILSYHVIDGVVDSAAALAAVGTTVEMLNGDDVAVTMREGKLFINNSEVIVTDIMATNGIIHVIDMVLTPPASPEPTDLMNIVDTAVEAGQFSTLVDALIRNGLDTALSDESQTFTVFAPTDEAFTALGFAGLILLGNESNILQYHVIAGAEIDSVAATAAAGMRVEMLNGESVLISLRDGDLFIDDSKVIAADIKASNGIIHVIDAVLFPPSLRR